jgi:hypothetical protein
MGELGLLSEVEDSGSESESEGVAKGGGRRAPRRVGLDSKSVERVILGDMTSAATESGLAMASAAGIGESLCPDLAMAFNLENMNRRRRNGSAGSRFEPSSPLDDSSADRSAGSTRRFKSCRRRRDATFTAVCFRSAVMRDWTRSISFDRRTSSASVLLNGSFTPSDTA